MSLPVALPLRLKPPTLGRHLVVVSIRRRLDVLEGVGLSAIGQAHRFAASWAWALRDGTSVESPS